MGGLRGKRGGGVDTTFGGQKRVPAAEMRSQGKGRRGVWGGTNPILGEKKAEAFKEGGPQCAPEKGGEKNQIRLIRQTGSGRHGDNGGEQ